MALADGVSNSPADRLPQFELLKMTLGGCVVQALYVAARLRIADLLAHGPRDCGELAAESGAVPEALYRVLRALAGVGVFFEISERRFRLTPMAELLRSDVANSCRGWIILMGAPFHWRAWEGLLHGVQSGQPAFDYVHGTDAFRYLGSHPEDAELFNDAMRSATAQKVSAVTAAYNFTRFSTVVDAGGGTGALIAAILNQDARLKGILADQPAVIEAARAQISAAGLGNRCECVGIDFFQSVPPGGDAYILSRVLHDWNDEQCIQILANCRRVIPPGGVLLAVETVIPSGNGFHIGKLGDLEILVMTPGKDRTETEYAQLFEKGGFHLTRVIPTESPYSLIEGRPAGEA